MPESTLHLEHLMQATKLLQLKKTDTLGDIEIIYDVCWMLTPSQIQKLMKHYYVADYEKPISREILKAVANRVTANDKKDILFLDTTIRYLTLDGLGLYQHNLLIKEYSIYVVI
ncbi:20280_t:CDS:2 [Dentiscutata erythropus]|uniref:20280_t:CDS:1 n=1 Tax=Dentiscutata erythropus TaxID=1348616 RepID=A0A9N9JEF9_9GLOM|nr:20280_t:CDS:2 [Dentiscutata erythropus]